MDGELPKVMQGVCWKVRGKTLGGSLFRGLTRLRNICTYSATFRVCLWEDPPETGSGVLSGEEWGP